MGVMRLRAIPCLTTANCYPGLVLVVFKEQMCEFFLARPKIFA
jgi:hypothetical protein